MVIDDQYDPKLVGIIVSTFADRGPDTVFNNTDLADDEAMILAIKGMTVIGLDNPLDAIEDINDDEERRSTIQQFGPFPIKDRATLKALAISFVVKSEDSTDHRIRTFGRFCVLFLIYNVEHTRLILDSYGLIEPYFNIISRDINYDKDLHPNNLNNVYRKMNMLFQGVLPRVFTVTDKGVIKELIGKEIMHRDVFLIADKKKKILYSLLADPEMSVWRKHEINRAAANLNSHLYKKKLTSRTVTELEEIAGLLKRYNLSVEGVSLA
ncbi:MAG: hypothetical protein E3J70_01790 [Candidatus Heimdallarchaeota archaeon]|nr:MAG: hypothetical protein E3J70_01790 [Candidatus Heimdallarchaeota archaeon]